MGDHVRVFVLTSVCHQHNRISPYRRNLGRLTSLIDCTTKPELSLLSQQKTLLFREEIMAITVFNASNFKIQASINHWGSEGSTNPYEISPGKTDSWGRSDKRGFVLFIESNGKTGSYLVWATSNVVVENNEVRVDGISHKFPGPQQPLAVAGADISEEPENMH
ncbi:hypothetical protein [Agrobacterium vitis]|uniref:hypothetical protein n=1 Tax=Agrobacterium vitis TaxID=373 RepID=UPI003D2B1AD0